MPRVVAVDYSLTKTGLAVITQKANGDCIANALKIEHKWPSTKLARSRAGLPEKAPLAERRKRFLAGAREVWQAGALDAATLVVMMAPLTSAKGQGPQRHDYLAGWWAIVGRCARLGVPVATAPDVTVKKAITGDGRADKAAVSSAMTKLYPHLEITSDDVSDAAAAAHLGAGAIGWDVHVLARYREVKWAEWPFELGDPFPALRGMAAA